MLWDIRAHDLGWDVEQLMQQALELCRHPRHRSTRPIREGDDADAVVGSREDLRVEAWQYPFVPDDAVPAGVAAEERKAHSRHPRIRLVLGLEHGCERRRFEH